MTSACASHTHTYIRIPVAVASRLVVFFLLLYHPPTRITTYRITTYYIYIHICIACTCSSLCGHGLHAGLVVVVVDAVVDIVEGTFHGLSLLIRRAVYTLSTLPAHAMRRLIKTYTRA